MQNEIQYNYENDLEDERQRRIYGIHERNRKTM